MDLQLSSQVQPFELPTNSKGSNRDTCTVQKMQLYAGKLSRLYCVLVLYLKSILTEYKLSRFPYLENTWLTESQCHLRHAFVKKTTNRKIRVYVTYQVYTKFPSNLNTSILLILNKNSRAKETDQAPVPQWPFRCWSVERCFATGARLATVCVHT